MSPIPSARSWATLSFPRVSGDEPYIQTCVQVAAEFSPRERG